jgi:hypothetical protein
MRPAALLALMLTSPLAATAADPPARPAAAKEGESWTHKDLLGYLKTKGVSLELKKSFPSITGLNATCEDANGAKLRIIKAKSAGDAKDNAALKDKFKNGFAWGRFIVDGDPALSAAAKKALAVE